MSVTNNLNHILSALPPNVRLIAVSKTQPAEAIMEAYNAGQRCFGENRVQELATKYALLPKDIEWHFIGHLQTNKVKYITSFVRLIHSIDSVELLKEVNKRAAQHTRVIDCLLQVHIAQEETKYGFSFDEAETLLQSGEIEKLTNVSITGLMGMATLTDDKEQIRKEFRTLSGFFKQNQKLSTANCRLTTLSVGMTGDYKLAIHEGSNMIRIGTAIFGNRQEKL